MQSTVAATLLILVCCEKIAADPLPPSFDLYNEEATPAPTASKNYAREWTKHTKLFKKTNSDVSIIFHLLIFVWNLVFYDRLKLLKIIVGLILKSEGFKQLNQLYFRD